MSENFFSDSQPDDRYDKREGDGQPDGLLKLGKLKEDSNFSDFSCKLYPDG